MTEEKNHSDRLEVSWVRVISVGLGLLLLLYTALNTRIDKIDQQKLDKAVFDEHQLNIGAMKSDISRIRDILEQHAVHFRPDR